MTRTPSAILDELLVLGAQSGDSEAWEMLVRRWHRPLVARAGRLLGDREAAADATQEAWLAIARGIRSLDDPGRFGAWASRILARRCVDAVRRLAREPRAVRAPDPPARAEHSPADEIASLRAGLARLPMEQRLLLSLRYAEGVPLRVISEIFGIPEGTAKSRLFAAREALRAMAPGRPDQPKAKE